MNRRSIAITLAAAALLGGCATYEPIPKGYTGPVATIQDSGFSEDGTKAQMFAVVEIDGNRVMNAFWASANASQGRGASLTTVYPSREVKAAPVRLKLRGSHATGAPIHAMASQVAGTFFSVEGDVEFTPVAGVTYRVNGELSKNKSSVWVENSSTKEKVSSIVTK